VTTALGVGVVMVSWSRVSFLLLVSPHVSHMTSYVSRTQPVRRQAPTAVSRQFCVHVSLSACRLCVSACGFLQEMA
jgi:hypothetical protein